jgi:hypothetical protein
MPCDFILERGLHKMTRTTNLKTIVLEKTLNLLFWKKKNKPRNRMQLMYTLSLPEINSTIGSEQGTMHRVEFAC